MYIGFQPDNEGFLHQSETFHFVCGHAHNHRLARADLVPADTATVLLNHPDSVFLRGIKFFVRELLERKSGECLRRSVVVRTHVTVETLVVCPYQFVPDFQRLIVEPPVETVSDFLYLGGGLLHGFLVRHTYFAAVPVFLLRYFRYGIVQGVYKQVLAVVIAHGIGIVCHGRISLQPNKVGIVHIEIHHVCAHPEEVGGEIGVQFRTYPPLAHVDVEFFVRNRFGYGILQCLCGRFDPFFLLTYKVREKRKRLFLLGDDVSGEELSFVLPFPTGRIVEDFPLERVDDFFFVLACSLCDVPHIDLAVKIQTACQSFYRRECFRTVYLLESDGFTHDVRLEDVLADLHFYREYLRAEAVEHNKLLVVVVVEKSPLGNKSVV